MDKELYKEIGRLIQLARAETGLSQSELAKAVGMNSPATISYYESGARAVPIDVLYQIAEATHKHITEFLPEPYGMVRLD